MTEKVASLYYILDQTNTITEVGGAWNRFAELNNGNAVLDHRVIGTPLLKHVAGDVSRSFIASMLDAARLLNKRRVASYRCDSPRHKRFMEMHIDPLSGGSLKITHLTIRTELLPAPLDFAAQGGRSRRRLSVRCTMCNRIKDKDIWREPDDALALEILSGDHVNVVVYGVCDGCRDALRRPRAAR